MDVPIDITYYKQRPPLKTFSAFLMSLNQEKLVNLCCIIFRMYSKMPPAALPCAIMLIYSLPSEIRENVNQRHFLSFHVSSSSVFKHKTNCSGIELILWRAYSSGVSEDCWRISHVNHLSDAVQVGFQEVGASLYDTDIGTHVFSRCLITMPEV